MTVWTRLLGWLKRTVFGVTAAPQIPAFAPVQAPRTKRKYTRHDVDKSQAHYYLGDLLDNLEDYFKDVEYLRRGDADTAANFEKYGCIVADSKQLVSTEFEPSFFEGELPAQGCIYFGRNEEEMKGSDTLNFRFMYFQKQNQPVNVQATNGQIYTLGGVMGIKERHLFRWHLAVFEDRSVKLLKEAQVVYHTVGKGSRRNGVGKRVSGNRHTFGRVEWKYPAWARDISAEWNQRNKTRMHIDEQFSWLFRWLTNCVAHAESDLNVRVRKQGKVATFAINMLRTPYFFADREKTVNENGNTERILHIVRPHTRTNRFGQKKLIKAHWRGLRRFTWNGYDVSIGMPGLHFMPLRSFTAAAWCEADVKRLGLEKVIDVTEVAQMIDNRLTAPQRAA